MVSETQPGCSGGIFGVSMSPACFCDGHTAGQWRRHWRVHRDMWGHSMMFDRRLPQVNLLWCVQTSASDTESQTQCGGCCLPRKHFQSIPALANSGRSTRGSKPHRVERCDHSYLPSSCRALECSSWPTMLLRTHGNIWNDLRAGRDE